MSLNGRRIYAIIPARGGSKGIPRKNIQPFLSKPLLTHSIDYALQAAEIDGIFVSTDDSEILQVSEQAGAEVIHRPIELSGDKATTESAVDHALTTWASTHELPDIIVLLQATSPYRPSGSLAIALEKFDTGQYDSLLSISPTHRFFWRVQGDEVRAEYDYLNRPRRQDMKPEDIRYVENGSLYIFTRAHFEASGNRLGGRIGDIVFDEEYSLEIDSWTDLKLLEEIATML